MHTVEVVTVSRVRLCVAALLAVTLGAAVSAQDKSKFELKLEKDKAFYQKMSTTVSQVIKVTNQDLTQKQESTFYFKWTPEKQEGDKWVIKQKVEGLEMSIDISGNPITYSSLKKDAPGAAGNPGLMDFFKSLEGAEFTVTLNTKDWKVEKVDGKDDFVKKLGAGNPQMDSLLKKIMTDDALKQMADPTYGLIPDQPKAVNETWEKKQTLALGPIGSYDVTYKFTYKGKDPTLKHLDRIEVDPTLTYKPPTDSTDGLLFKIKSGDLKSVPRSPTDPVPLPPSVVLYNPATGRVEKATISLKLKGELTVTIGGTDTKVELEQTQTTTIDSSNESLIPGATPPAKKP
ncbi:MAG: hypothetical protein JWO38_2930 [Gemmataceae bacterium]|nr:hypothetical protein [Gemmataceae bacterium]